MMAALRMGITTTATASDTIRLMVMVTGNIPITSPASPVMVITNG